MLLTEADDDNNNDGADGDVDDKDICGYKK